MTGHPPDAEEQLWARADAGTSEPLHWLGRIEAAPEVDADDHYLLHAHGIAVTVSIKPDGRIGVIVRDERQDQTGGDPQSAPSITVEHDDDGDLTELAQLGGHRFDRDGPLECGVCGGPACWNPQRWRYEHATTAHREWSDFPGGEVYLAAHNLAGALVPLADITAADTGSLTKRARVVVRTRTGAWWEGVVAETGEDHVDLAVSRSGTSGSGGDPNSAPGSDSGLPVHVQRPGRSPEQQARVRVLTRDIDTWRYVPEHTQTTPEEHSVERP